MEALIQAMEDVVEDLHGHVHRVSSVASAIGRTMHLEDDDVDRLTTVGVLHDVGKIHVDPRILAKPGPLVGDELVCMRRHPEFGFAMTVELFDHSIAQAILFHHERWDGDGYPYGLAKEQIPLLARIVLVADAFDAITSHRSYQPALPVDYAVDEILRNTGSQFDPTVVEAFMALIETNAIPGRRALAGSIAAR